MEEVISKARSLGHYAIKLQGRGDKNVPVLTDLRFLFYNYLKKKVIIEVRSLAAEKHGFTSGERI